MDEPSTAAAETDGRRRLLTLGVAAVVVLAIGWLWHGARSAPALPIVPVAQLWEFEDVEALTGWRPRSMGGAMNAYEATDGAGRSVILRAGYVGSPARGGAAEAAGTRWLVLEVSCVRLVLTGFGMERPPAGVLDHHSELLRGRTEAWLARHDDPCGDLA
jgi:hypothetical protein